MLLLAALCALPAFSQNLIVEGKACIGVDCADGELFGLDIQKLKHNNTRLLFEDTSTSAGFPATDWRLTANDTTSGGQDRNMQLFGTLTQGSSRDIKTGFGSLDPREALHRVSALPISLWSYKADGPAVRHLGPMAEDFHSAFGLGPDDEHVAPSDQAGVALLALQGLHQVVQEKDREIADLQGRLEELERIVAKLAGR